MNAYVVIVNDCSSENVEPILFKIFNKYNKVPIKIIDEEHKIINSKRNKIHYLKHLLILYEIMGQIL